jgi:oligoribonuclease NrnB/cAMP/cGMP phosphodiesterase (DHH superfamily)
MLDKKDPENITVLYHANCPDGFGSAWAFWKRYGKSAKYIAVKHGQSPPNVSGRDVFIVDFSYQRNVLLELKRSANSLVVLDHHITAKKELDDLDFCIFDMNHSGAYLSWRYLFGPDNIPRLILYIEDRDLWNWSLVDSEKILSAIDSYEKDFDVWDNIHSILESKSDAMEPEGTLLVEGAAILRYKNELISKLMGSRHSVSIFGRDIPSINTSFFQSELGALLAMNSYYSAVYYYNGEGYIFSLRSSDDGADVSEIAKSFGGGGHKRAAGFFIESLHLLDSGG